MNIRKIRVVPRGYKEIPAEELLVGAFGGVSRGDVFMNIYTRVGKPDDSMGYLLKTDNFVLYLSYDNPTNDKLYASAAVLLDAEKRRVKTINMIVRKANSDGVAYVPKDDMKLYFIVNSKNSVLLDKARKSMSDKAIEECFMEYIGNNGKEKIDGTITQYVVEAKDMLNNFVNEFGNGAH